MDDKARDRAERARVVAIIKADVQDGHLARQFSIDARNPATWGGPTPQARAQALAATGKPLVAKICPLARMHDKGRIDDDQHRAALDIVRAFELITQRLGPSLMTYEERVDGVFNQAQRDMVEDYHRRLLTRYATWREAMATELLNFGAVVAVVVDGMRCRDVEGQYGKRNGWASAQVMAALALYVKVNSPHAMFVNKAVD